MTFDFYKGCRGQEVEKMFEIWLTLHIIGIFIMTREPELEVIQWYFEVKGHKVQIKTRQKQAQEGPLCPLLRTYS